MVMNKKFPITASFIDEITYDIPSSNWSDEQWCADLDNMKDVGIDTLVIMRGAFYNKCIYPSKIFPTLKKENEDFAGLILNEAAKRNMKVYMGLYISNLCWNEGDSRGELKQNKLYVDEVLSRYGDIPSFKGWYIPHEASYNAYSLKDTMEGLAKLCKDKTPDKRIIISPFFKSSAFNENFFTPERTVDEWDKIWQNCGKEIDECAFQDGTVSLEEYASYLKAMKGLCNDYNISLWANVETFERDVRNMFYPIPFDVLRKVAVIALMSLGAMIVSSCMIFSFVFPLNNNWSTF
jgi:hypothetical protein